MVATLLWILILRSIGIYAAVPNRIAQYHSDAKKTIVVPANPNQRSDREKHVYKLGDGSAIFLGMLTIDADGAPTAYGPHGSSRVLTKGV